MAKPICVNEPSIDEILTDLRRQLTNNRIYGEIRFNRTLKSDTRKARLYFTPSAWLKMTLLTSEYTTEVQWHGLVRRMSETSFEVYDIIVPPHVVTSTTVTSDPKEYSEWINALDDDSFNALKFHGHSHVYMDVTPSGVDNEYRRNLVTQLPQPTNSNDVFYIFMIINKKHNWSAEIYDFTNNALYSTVDKNIEIDVIFDDAVSIYDFIDEAKKNAVEKKYTSQPTVSKTTEVKKEESSCANDKDKKNENQGKSEKKKEEKSAYDEDKEYKEQYERLRDYYRNTYGIELDDDDLAYF